MNAPVTILNPGQRKPRLQYAYGRGTAYEEELNLTAALEALVPGNELRHPDQRTFQILHLITEMAWVGIHDSLCTIDAALACGDLIVVNHAFGRATLLAAMPTNCLRVLTDSLPQATFLAMRQMLADGASGLDSPGSRNLRKAGAEVWASFEAALAARGASLDDLSRADNDDLRMLASVMHAMHAFDSRILEWRQSHLNLVWQLLGGHPTSAGHQQEQTPTSMRGRPITDLERLAARPLFPLLWQHSTNVYRTASNGTY